MNRDYTTHISVQISERRVEAVDALASRLVDLNRGIVGAGVQGMRDELPQILVLCNRLLLVEILPADLDRLLEQLLESCGIWSLGEMERLERLYEFRMREDAIAVEVQLVESRACKVKLGRGSRCTEVEWREASTRTDRRLGIFHLRAQPVEHRRYA